MRFNKSQGRPEANAVVSEQKPYTICGICDVVRGNAHVYMHVEI